MVYNKNRRETRRVFLAIADEKRREIIAPSRATNSQKKTTGGGDSRDARRAIDDADNHRPLARQRRLVDDDHRTGGLREKNFLIMRGGVCSPKIAEKPSREKPNFTANIFSYILRTYMFFGRVRGAI